MLSKAFVFLGAILLLLMPALVYPAITDFTADGDITVPAVTGAGVTADLLILSGSQAESWSYDEGVLTVTNPGIFRVGSADSQVLALQVLTASNLEACSNNSVPGSSFVQLPEASAVYAVQPSGSACLASSPSGTPQSSGSLPRSVSEVIPTPIINFNNPLAPLVLTRPLAQGMSGADVRSLQQFLNRNGFVVAVSGPGSPGLETAFFGPATRLAVIKFQVAHRIILWANADGAGLVGPKTRARISLISNLRYQLEQLVGQLNKLKNEK